MSLDSWLKRPSSLQYRIKWLFKHDWLILYLDSQPLGLQPLKIYFYFYNNTLNLFSTELFYQLLNYLFYILAENSIILDQAF